jgi:uncharacterized surface protein with fasciclin (FAS1) repeats
MAKDIVQTIKDRSDLSTFWKAVDQSGVDSELRGKGPYTVLAPTNEAFEQLDTSTLNQLMDKKNRSQLRDIIRGHIFRESMKASDFKRKKKARPMYGNSVPYKESGNQVKLGDATVERADISCSNGVIHTIDNFVTEPKLRGT